MYTLQAGRYENNFRQGKTYSPSILHAHCTLHNVLFGQYVFLPTEQAANYLKIYVLIYHSTYICPTLFGWKENLIFKKTVIFKL